MSSIPYPKTWVSGEILTAADLNAQFAAVNSITSIQESQIADGAVTTNKLGALAVTAAKIAANAVTTVKILDANVTVGKLAVGASVNTRQTAAPIAGTVATVETTILTLPAITTRGGPVHLYGTLSITHELAASGVDSTAILRIKRDAVTLDAFQYTSHATGGGVDRRPVPTPILVDLPGAGTYVYTITAESSGGIGSVIVESTNQGIYHAEEGA